MTVIIAFPYSTITSSTEIMENYKISRRSLKRRYHGHSSQKTNQVTAHQAMRIHRAWRSLNSQPPNYMEQSGQLYVSPCLTVERDLQTQSRSGLVAKEKKSPLYQESPKLLHATG
jgi:hypothetical protein